MTSLIFVYTVYDVNIYKYVTRIVWTGIMLVSYPVANFGLMLGYLVYPAIS